jgi:hypothetical protein
MENEMNKKQVLEKILVFKEMLNFFEFTSLKYNDNKDQRLTRLEGILTDCIIKKEARASFLDLTREKISEDAEFGCRERMVYFNESNNIKLICIGAIFLIKVIVNGVDMDKALQECVAYRNNKIMVKSTRSKQFELFDISDKDLIILMSEYIMKNIKSFNKVDLDKKLTDSIVNAYLELTK